MNRMERFLIGCCAVIVLYFGTYALLYLNRKPAGDLAYWCYTTEEPRNGLWGEDTLYYLFYPVYIIHQRVFAGQRHIFDFYYAPIPADFKG